MFKIIRIDFDTAARTYVSSRDDRELAFAVVICANQGLIGKDSAYYYTVEEPVGA